VPNEGLAQSQKVFVRIFSGAHQGAESLQLGSAHGIPTANSFEIDPS
jgi:hypothetical protein